MRRGFRPAPRAALRAAIQALLVAGAARGATPVLTAQLDTGTITLGDPIRLRVRVERDAGDRTLFPELEEEALAPLVPRRASSVRTAEDGRGGAVDERTYELTTFTPDADRVPPLSVDVVRAGGDTLELSSPAIPIRVVPVRAPEEGDDLRPIKPPVAIPGGIPLWLAGLLAAVLAVGVALLAARLLRRRASAPQAAAPAAPVDYEREFARIAELGLLERGGLKVYYTQLSEVMRRFLEHRLGIDAMERTTAQIAAAVADWPPPPDPQTLRQIVRFLEAADLVKFAKAEPPMSEARQAPERGRDLVVALHDQLRAAAEEAAAADGAGTAGGAVAAARVEA